MTVVSGDGVNEKSGCVVVTLISNACGLTREAEFGSHDKQLSLRPVNPFNFYRRLVDFLLFAHRYAYQPCQTRNNVRRANKNIP